MALRVSWPFLFLFSQLSPTSLQAPTDHLSLMQCYCFFFFPRENHRLLGETPSMLFPFSSSDQTPSSFWPIPSLPYDFSEGKMSCSQDGHQSEQRAGECFQSWKKLETKRQAPIFLATFCSLSLMDWPAQETRGPFQAGTTMHHLFSRNAHGLTTKSHRIQMQSGSLSRSFESDFSISSQPKTHTHPPPTHTLSTDRKNNQQKKTQEFILQQIENL